MVFSQSHTTVSTNVSSLGVAAFDLAYCSLSVLWSINVLDISKQLPQSGYRFVCNAYVVRLWYTCVRFRCASDVQ